MSVLSNTQGTPRRVYALLKLISVLNGPASRATVEALMTAKAEGADEDGQPSGTAFRQTLGAARDLNLVTETDGVLSVVGGTCPPNYLTFADLVHGRLISRSIGEGDSVVMDAFAYVAHRTDREQGPHWVMDADRKVLADALRDFIDSKREGEGRGTFNDTRLSPWQKWTDLVGVTLPMENSKAFPSVAVRLSREIAADHRFKPHDDIPARLFIDCVLDRMPYLPGGARSLELLGPPVTNKVTDLLGAALRELEADGLLGLHTVGDAGNAVTLPSDEVWHERSFNIIRLTPTELSA